MARDGEGRSSDLVESWIDKLGRESATAEPHGARQETAYKRWFDEQRCAATVGASGWPRRRRLCPVPLWFVLGLGAFVTIAYMCAQADRREGVLIQSIPIGFFSALVTAGLLVVFFLDHPYANESGSIMPTEMRRTLTLIDHGSATPCDERGIPRPT